MLSLAVGLDGLIALVHRNGDINEFDFHGVSRLTAQVRHYAAVCALGTCTQDVFLIELFKDDRLLRHVEKFEEVLKLTLQSVLDRDEYVYGRLAPLVGVDCDADSLRAAVVKTAFAGAAFIDEHTLKQTRELPLSLAVGDIERTVKEFAEGPLPANADLVTTSIWKAINIAGCPLEPIMNMVSQWREISFTTIIVEQGHGSGAVIAKYHGELSGEALLARSLLHSGRSFFRPSAEEKAIRKTQAYIDWLEQQQPWKVTGRHMYFKALVSGVAENLGHIPGGFGPDGGAPIMRQHARMYDVLSPPGESHVRAGRQGARSPTGCKTARGDCREGAGAY